jgi:aminoacrylate hydrolase
VPRINIGDLYLNCEDDGEGTPFLMIPGLMGLLDAWDFQVAHFRKRYRCIRFDHRGTGDSDKPKDAYSTRLIAEDAVRLLDALGIERAHVAGTSTGGCVLQNLAIDHPDRLLSCIFTNTWTRADEYITRVQTSRMRIAQSYGPEEYVKFSSLWTCGPNQFRYDWEKVRALEARQMKTIAPVDVLLGRLRMTLEHDRSGELHRITRPSLVIGLSPATSPGICTRRSRARSFT